MDWNRQHISLQKIEEEYIKDPVKDDDRMYRIKEIIFNDLDDLDRALLIMYADLESMAKTGKVFSVSSSTIYTRIKKIREIIEKKLNDYECDS